MHSSKTADFLDFALDIIPLFAPKFAIRNSQFAIRNSQFAIVASLTEFALQTRA